MTQYGASTRDEDEQRRVNTVLDWASRIGNPAVDGSVMKIGTGAEWESSPDGARVIFNSSGVRGVDENGITQFMIRDSDGKGVFMSDDVELDVDGMHLLHGVLTPAIFWDAGATVADISGSSTGTASNIRLRAPGSVNTAALTLVGSATSALVNAGMTAGTGSVTVFNGTVSLQADTPYYLNITTSAIEAAAGNTVKLAINTTDSRIQFDTNDYLGISATGLTYQFSGTDRLTINTTDARLKHDTDDYILVAATGFQHIMAGVTRIDVTSSASRLKFDTNDYMEITSSGLHYEMGGTQRISVTSTASLLLLDSNDYLSISASDFVYQMAGTARIAVNSSESLMKLDASNYFRIYNSGFEVVFQGNTVLNVANADADGQTNVIVRRQASGSDSNQRILWKDFSSLAAGDKVCYLAG